MLPSCVNCDRAAAQAFAHVVIGLTGQMKVDSRGQEGAKALSGSAVKFQIDGRRFNR